MSQRLAALTRPGSRSYNCGQSSALRALAREKAYMQVVVNGQTQAVPDGSNLAQLLEQLALEPRRVAVELNKRLVPRGQFGLTALGDNDQLEIVTLVGGG